MTKKLTNALRLAEVENKLVAMRLEMDGFKKLLKDAAHHNNPWDYVKDWWNSLGKEGGQ